MTLAVWTDERVEKLKLLFQGGATFSVIAAELGGTTRNAAIGKATRLGLNGRPKREPKPRARRVGAPVMKRLPRPVAQASRSIAEAFELESAGGGHPVDYDMTVPVGQRLALFDLNEAVCHWPVGDPGMPEFFFCGGKALPSLPYCAQHSRIAYQKPRSRQRSAEDLVPKLSHARVKNDFRR